MAVIKVFCKNWAVKFQLLTRIKSSIKSMPTFKNTSLHVVDTGNALRFFLILSFSYLLTSKPKPELIT